MALVGVVLLVSNAPAARPSPTLPAQIPTAERARLQEVADAASVSARAAGEPFLARPEVFEFLLDHPEFATHVTRALRLARYRIWRTPEGLWLDDGWGAVGQFSVVYSAGGTRVMYARGHYQPGFLPNIHGQAVVVIEYDAQPSADHKSLISTAVTGFVKLDSHFLAVAGRLASAVATAKAEKEAQRLVKVFARASRAIDDNPAHVHEKVRQRQDVPSGDLEEFRRLLHLP
ncbi:MAG: hypothetical protein DME04_00790 [Candidatus Rokuibacteriota bacterium]|nr:MAG: hypothetical protein DME04_00790 [Candidatus Rokubacteria bacterium]